MRHNDSTNHPRRLPQRMGLPTSFFDLTNPAHAYFYGLIQTDGSMYQSTRNRGRLAIEIKIEDRSVLEQFASMLPYNSRIYSRTRASNFSEKFESVVFQVCDMRFREELVQLGMVYGKKSRIVGPPACTFSEADYFRGVIDGDGSLGLTAAQFPFLSLVTASDSLAFAYLDFIRGITGKHKRASRNNRDGVFNIAIYKEDAQAVIAVLYYSGCIALPRKKRAAESVLIWKRPESMRKFVLPKKSWSDEQDNFILTHTITEASQVLYRTEQSIKMRLWRLRGSNN